MYLPAEAQDRLFAQISGAERGRAAGSRRKLRPATPTSDAKRCGIGSSRLPTNSASSETVDVEDLMYRDENRAVVADWLNDHGWRASAQNSGDEMRRLGRWVDGVPMADDKDAFRIRDRGAL